MCQLFPGEYAEPAEAILLEALDGGDSRALQPGRRPLFILLDATWSEARKMFRKSPYPRWLPVLSLPRI